jgi:RNA polymerase sigma-70 factor (sigma-E family)
LSIDEEFAEFVNARWARFVKSAVLLGCSPGEAEDLAQTAMARCYVAWPKVSAARDRDAYAYRVLLNCHRDSRRRHWWRERPTDDLPEMAVADRTVSSDVAIDVERALSRLSTPAREAVVLRYYAHLTEQEMAAVLGVAPGTVKSRLSRALAELSRDHTLVDPPDRTDRAAPTGQADGRAP